MFCFSFQIFSDFRGLIIELRQVRFGYNSTSERRHQMQCLRSRLFHESIWGNGLPRLFCRNVSSKTVACVSIITYLLYLKLSSHLRRTNINQVYVVILFVLISSDFFFIWFYSISVMCCRKFSRKYLSN